MRWRQAVTLLLLALIVTPAASQVQNRRVRSLAEIRFGNVILQQWDLSCGAAALATLFTFDMGDPVSEREVATAMLHETDPIRVRTRGGFSLLNMQEFAQSRGYTADGYGNLTLDDLRALLPAIVPLELHGYEHFVVVRAVGGDQIFFADPAYGVRTLARPAFERAWTRKVALAVARK